MALPRAGQLLRGSAARAARRHIPLPPIGQAPAVGQPEQPQLPDWQADPILQRINAQQQAAVASAQASALAQRQQAEIAYGYTPGYGYADSQTAQAAQQNPFSVLSQLHQGHDLANRGIDEGANRSNLFYSSTRGEQLGQESQSYLHRQYDAQRALQGQLSGITQNLLNTQTGATNAINQGASDAYDRALNFQLQYGGDYSSPQAPGSSSSVTPSPGVPHVRAAQVLARQRPRLPRY